MEQVEGRKVRVRLIVHGDKFLEAVRCTKCSALLFKAKMPLHKASEPLGIEVKCRRCGYLNRY